MFNIRLFKEIRNRFSNAIDSVAESTINVHVGGEMVLKFEEVELRLYLLRSDNCTTNSVSAYSFLIFVRANKENVTKRQIKRADTAREFKKHLN